MDDYFKIRAVLIDKFDFMNYDTGVLLRNYVPFFKDKVVNRMRSYHTGNHEFTVQKNDLDFTLGEHKVPFEYFTISFSDLSYVWK